MVFRTVGHEEQVERYKTFNVRNYTLADLKNAVKQLTNPKVPVSKYKNKTALMEVLVERGAEDLLFKTPKKVFKKESKTKRIPRPEGAAPKYGKKKIIGASIPREIRAQMAAQRKEEQRQKQQVQRNIKEALKAEKERARMEKKLNLQAAKESLKAARAAARKIPASTARVNKLRVEARKILSGMPERLMAARGTMLQNYENAL